MLSVSIYPESASAGASLHGSQVCDRRAGGPNYGNADDTISRSYLGDLWVKSTVRSHAT